jgi:predicted phosphodiesterase
MVHNLADLDQASLLTGFSAVIYGHSHRPKIERRGAVWFINPGSCGPKRFQLPVTMAMLEIEGDGKLSAELIELNV